MERKILNWWEVVEKATPYNMHKDRHYGFYDNEAEARRVADCLGMECRPCRVYADTFGL